jgi:hypothetical protein
MNNVDSNQQQQQSINQSINNQSTDGKEGKRKGCNLIKTLRASFSCRSDQNVDFIVIGAYRLIDGALQRVQLCNIC